MTQSFETTDLSLVGRGWSGAFGGNIMIVIWRIVAGVVASIALVVAFNGFREMKADSKLRESHLTAPGQITSQSAGAHGIVDYKFSVAGREYGGRGVAAERREYGAPVTVYFCPRDPSISALHDPKEWQVPGWAAVIIPTFIFVIGSGMAAGLIGFRGPT